MLHLGCLVAFWGGYIGSFLHERTFSVVHGSTRARWVPAPYGLPQGSVLGPLLYIYTSGLPLLLAEHGALGQLYADDTQAYMHCVSSKAATTVRAMGHTLTALETWMASNRLCLNPAKTKFMWLGTPQQLAKLNLIDLSAEFPNYTFSSSVRDLGIILDQALTFAPHLNRLNRDCFYQFRQLRTFARSLSSGAAETLVHSFITIRLDYCLSLYSGLPSVRLASLSRVLRSAARLIGQIPKFGHVSSYMVEVLHWLPIRQRIEYRVASLVWRCQLGLAPTYLIDLCRPVSGSRSSRSLRSSERGLLLVPFARTTIMQSRACSVVAPMVWNSLHPAPCLLPRTLSDTFYNQLKTVLFDRAGVGLHLSSFLDEVLYKSLNE